METISTTYHENLKRYWRRKKYQRMYGINDKKSIKIEETWSQSNTNSIPKEEYFKKPLKRVFSPIKVVSKFHKTYIEAMNRMAGSVAHKSSGAGAFAGKKVAKTKHISMASCGEELVSNELVLDIYKRVTASRRMNSVSY